MSVMICITVTPKATNIFMSAIQTGWSKHWTISMAWLKTSRSLHLPPINLLVSEGPMTKVNLGNGFTLRCFQRLSVPNVATQRCPW